MAKTRGIQKIDVEVQQDFIQMLAKARPVDAVAELVWNGLDADALRVDIRLSIGAAGRIDEIHVSDDGDGIPYEEVVPAFKNLGGSWKKTATRTRRRGRLLHGQFGKGRFKAFALGEIIEWRTRYRDTTGKIQEYTISSNRSTPKEVVITEPLPSKKKTTGTDVVIFNVSKNFGSLRKEKAVDALTEQFALYLLNYKSDVTVVYEGDRIDPEQRVARTTDLSVGPVFLDGSVEPIYARLTVIEWTISFERSLYYCDEGGFAFAQTPLGAIGRGYKYTAYLQHDTLRQLNDRNEFVLGELSPAIKDFNDAARNRLRDYFRERAAEDAANVIDDWKTSAIYPFEGEPESAVERVERQVFDVVAVNIQEYMPSFETAEATSKRLTLRLLKEALETSPTAVQRIFREVLNLPEEKQEELSDLLTRVSLTAMIDAARMVTERLDFLAGLKLALFEEPGRSELLERDHLQQMLVRNTWIFGEEFNLQVDDEDLDKVLVRHLELLGRSRDEVRPDHVLREDGRRGRVDMMLSCRVPMPRDDERSHLVVELKRPTRKIDSSVASQIESYALAVSQDERFRDTSTTWSFWAISNEISPEVTVKARQHGVAGLLMKIDELRLRVWIKSWGQLLNECEGRLRFFQRQLNYNASDDAAMEYLRKAYEKFLPKALLLPAVVPTSETKQ